MPLRALVVEDSPTDAKLVVQALRRTDRTVESERVDTSEAMRAALERQTWDVVVSDWSMPKFSGLEALELVKKMGIDVPFIIVSGTVGEEHAVAAMRAGAHDYVLKDKLTRLAPAVEREIREHQLRVAHRQAESARLQAEERLRRIIDSGMLGVWSFDAEGKTKFMNGGMAKMLRLTVEEAAQASIADFVEEQDRPGVKDRLAQRRAGLSATYEHRFLRKDGTFGWGIFEANPLHDAHGAFEGVLTLATDITERRNADEARREAELRFRRLFDSGIIGIMVADESGRIHEANDTFLQMLGYSVEDLRAGKLDWSTMTPAKWRMQQPAVSEELRARGSSRPFEKEYLHKDGSPVPVLVGIATLDGSRLLTVVTNLTERRRAEQAEDRARRAAAPGAEDGGDRAARRGRGARLQQRAVGHPELLRARRRRLEGGRPRPRRSRRDSRAGRARRGPHAPATHVQPAAGHRAAGGRSRTTCCRGMSKMLQASRRRGRRADDTGLGARSAVCASTRAASSRS